MLVMTLGNIHIGIKMKICWNALKLCRVAGVWIWSMTISCILKNAGLFWWRQCWWNQTIEAKATRALQRSCWKVWRRFLFSKCWMRTSSIKNYNPLEQHWRQRWVGCTICRKLYTMKFWQKHIMTKSYPTN